MIRRACDSLPLALADTVVPHLTGPREELSVLVKANSHDSIGDVECLFDTITVMYVYIDVDYSLMIPAKSAEWSIYLQ